jgi:hypothetical protein
MLLRIIYIKSFYRHYSKACMQLPYLCMYIGSYVQQTINIETIVSQLFTCGVTQCCSCYKDRPLVNVMITFFAIRTPFRQNAGTLKNNATIFLCI